MRDLHAMNPERQATVRRMKRAYAYMLIFFKYKGRRIGLIIREDPSYIL